MRRKLYLYIFVLIFPLLSCNDWLDILPKNEQVTADYWKSKEDVQAMLASGYYYMRATSPTLIKWGELRASSVIAFNMNEEEKLQNFQLTPLSSLCLWGTFYEAINMANSVIKYAPEVKKIDRTYSEQAMRSHQTEAYFMRALMYFYLVRNFKEVPLILTPYIDDSAPYEKAKSTEEEIISQILSDIEVALDANAAKEFFDDETWDGATKGRATKWALYALMADVALWAEKYDLCIEYSNKILNSNAAKRPAFMTIPEQWFSIFNPGNSNESIFELNWDYSSFAQTANSPSNYFTIGFNSLFQFSNAMGERLDAETELFVNSTLEPVRSYWGAYVKLNAEGETPNYCVWKYRGTEINDLNAIRINADANFIIYRMADVILMKAEALVKKGSANWAEALELINIIRVRSNLSKISLNLTEVTELEMLEILLNERDIELAAEGKRWYDLLRFAKTDNYKYKAQFIEIIIENNNSTSASWLRSVLRNEYAWYLPISEYEIEVNDKLEQNPYYSVTKK